MNAHDYHNQHMQESHPGDHTLTVGDIERKELLRLATAVEQGSQHPIEAGVLACWGIILSPAVGAVLMSLSTVVMAINARFLKVN